MSGRTGIRGRRSPRYPMDAELYREVYPVVDVRELAEASLGQSCATPARSAAD